MIAGIVLAAGLSRRMGQPKLLLPLAGRAVVRHATERLLTAGLDPVIVVVGAEREAIESALDGLPVRIAVNPRPEAGQAGSVRSGIGSVPPEVEGALVALGDQPFVAPHVIAGLLEAWRASGKSIAAPRYRDGLGNPVVFRLDVFPELASLDGDRGARAMIERDPGRVALVEFDVAMPGDVDTPEDYDRLRSERPV